MEEQSLRVMVPISVGELIDKITILEIKLKCISDLEKKRNVIHELELLREIFLSNGLKVEELKFLINELRELNLELWHLEDLIRIYENQMFFGEDFVKTARQIYIKNDMRSEVKRKISIKTNSEIIEEKHFVQKY